MFSDHNAMWSSIFALGLILLVCHTGALDSEKCKIPPQEKHCIIVSVLNRLPLRIRYYFDWEAQECVFMRWASYCRPPKGTNNFESYYRCRDECSGWA